MYSCYIEGAGKPSAKSSTSHRSATSDAQNAILGSIIKVEMSTSTQIGHLSFPKRHSQDNSEIGDVDLNADRPPQMPRTPFSIQFSNGRCRPQRRSAPANAQNAILGPILKLETSTLTQIGHLGCPRRRSRVNSGIGDVSLNADRPLQMPRMPFWAQF